MNWFNFLVFLSLFSTLWAAAGKKSKNKHVKLHYHDKKISWVARHLPTYCRVICEAPAKNCTKDDQEQDDDYDDANDNEDPKEATMHPPNHVQDIYINNESGDEPGRGKSPLVDFIAIKHRFSNQTDLSFPAYFPGEKKARKRKEKKQN